MAFETIKMVEPCSCTLGKDQGMLGGGGIISNGMSSMQSECFPHKYSVNPLFLLQEHPFLFTSRNSEWQSSGSTSKNSAVVPYWAVIVAVAAGILAGSLIVWVLMARRVRRQPQADNTATEEQPASF